MTCTRAPSEVTRHNQCHVNEAQLHMIQVLSVQAVNLPWIWATTTQQSNSNTATSCQPLHPTCCSITLDYSLELTGRPTTIEVSRLGLDFFAINEALPWSSIERYIALDILEARGRTFVAPYSIGHFLIVRRRLDCVICGPALPFTKGWFLGCG